jgi:hypothetical protein
MKKNSRRKKNRMPAALKRYWAQKRSKKRSKNSRRSTNSSRRSSRKRSVRRRNARRAVRKPKTMHVSNRSVAVQLVKAMRKMGFAAKLVVKSRKRKKH